MNQITALEIKKKFLEFFQNNHHLIINNSSIIPKNDPSLLFINSGMAPLKRFFTGEETPPSKRLCNMQSCIRTIDIDEIGDKHHLTSFQMLGSWSIGDYFKKDAINFAFEFLTKHLDIPKEKLYVTVFGGDSELQLESDYESKQCWISVGIPEDHIIFCPKKDNFWGPTSETGPCGPCTEVFYDTGDSNGQKYKPGDEFDTQKRYIEIWNAGVFMQLYKHQDSTYSKLKFKSVDTGAGLERLAMVLNKKDNVYDTDLLSPIKDKIIEQLNKNDSITKKEIFILTDHLRTICLILSEKITPSNEGRGYIPRKLIRKCISIIVKSNINHFDFKDIINFITDHYQNMFPNFSTNKDYILNTFNNEYNQFIKIITLGLQKLEIIKNENKEITSDIAFGLVTTFGLPFDIIKDYALENNLTIDQKGLDIKLSQHKKISKNNKNINEDSSFNIDTIDLSIIDNLEPTIFNGYNNLETSTKILNIIKDNKLTKQAIQGDKIILILKQTTFYAESGGQCSDVGFIYNDNFKIKISNVQKTISGVFLHIGEILSGEINLNTSNNVNLSVNADIRQNLSNNHTSVHLLHSALRSIFGHELHQAGSKVEPNKFRFDFNYDKKIDMDDIFKLEQIVNDYIRMNVKIKIEHKSLNDAIKDGAIALFENKYSNNVRVVSIANFSKELCGGTHTEATGNIGLFTILSVEGIGKGIKRISATTGKEALKHLQSQTLLINNISKTLNLKSDKILDQITKLKTQSYNNVNTKKQTNLSNISYQIKETLSGIKYTYISHSEFDKSLRNTVISLSDKINGIVLYIGGNDIKQILIAVSKQICEKYPANNILSNILSQISGKGGGSPRIASGGRLTVNIDKLLFIFENLISTLK